MSRVNKFGKRNRNANNDIDEMAAALEAEWGLEQDETAKEPLPPRGRSHPSNKQQMTRWFYRVLIVLFILLLAGLLWWGWHFQ